MSGSTERPAAHPRRHPLAPALSRADLDRDYLTRLGGAAALLDDPRSRVVVLHDGRALGTPDGALALLDATALPDLDPDALVFLGRIRTASADVEQGAAVLAVVVDELRAADFDGTWLD